MTDFITPAELSEDMTKKVKECAIKAFKACSCRSVSRVDFVITEEEPYILEVNTSPGMTDTSDLPAQTASMGISYDELVELTLKSAGLNK
jgi:D-alanine-D-alanine ligase